MTPKQRRMALAGGIVVGVALAGGLALRAFQENVAFYYDPTKVANGEVRPGQRFRLGGMVVVGSVQRTVGTLDINFVVTDFQHTVPVRYNKVLPNLFKENSGMVADGRLDASGTFIADEVLAKHDEKYMPPALKKSLEQGKAASADGATTTSAVAPATASGSQDSTPHVY
jgi:cytochrome c-type biogenesis protein CcmE